MILSICDVPETLKVMRIVKLVLQLIRIVVPIMLMISIMLDYVKVITGKDDALSKANKNLVRRGMAAVLVFLIPTFVSLIFSAVNPNFEYKKCFDMATTEQITMATEKYMSNLVKEATTKRDIGSYYAAKTYLSNIGDETKKKEFEQELNSVKKEIDEKIEKEEQRHATGSWPLTVDTSNFLATAKSVYDYMVNGDKYFTYQQGNQIPLTGSVCDCSSLVSWVIYEYGYNDFKGSQQSTHSLYVTDWRTRYGWQEAYFDPGTDLTNIVYPGDIVVRVSKNEDGGPGYGHTQIIANVDNRNAIRAYDCGSDGLIKHGAHPNGSKANWFLDDDRMAKIIRVTAPH